MTRKEGPSARAPQLGTVSAEGTLGDRCRACREVAPAMKPGLADQLAGLPNGTMRRLESGRTTNPTRDTMSAVAKLYATNIHWLSTGEGDAPTVAAVRKAIEEAGQRLGRRVAGTEDAA